MTIDFTRLFVDRSQLDEYVALDVDTTREYGKTVRAVEMSNVDYSVRHRKLAECQTMKPPPSHSRIFAGYLVVRKPGTKGEYETWMPDHVFDDLYMATPLASK